ncbi:MAG: S9 family peptidase [Vicinamibacteria bacterium]
MKSAVRCSVVLTFVAASALSAGSAFVPEDHYLLRSVSEVAISLDGTRLAFVERWVDRERNETRSRVLVLSLPDGEPRAVSDEELDADRPRWSPDGSRLAYLQGGGATLGPREVDEPRASNVVVVEMSDGSREIVASFEPSNDPLAYQGVGNSLTWSPGGDRLAFLSSDPGPEPPPGDPMVITRYDYKSWAGMNDNRRWHVYVVSLEDKSVRRLTEGEYHEQSIAWSPSGEEIVFVSNRGPDWHRIHNYDLFAVRVADGTIRQLTRTEGVEYTPAWSFDGETLAYRGGRRSLSTRESSAEDWHLWAIPAAGGKARELAPGLDRRVMSVAWAPDEPVVYFTAEDRGSTFLYRADAEGGAPERVSEQPGRIGEISVARSGVVAYTFETVAGPAEVYLKKRTEEPQAITSTNAGLLAERRVSIPESFEFRSFDGTPVEGFLVPPLEWETGKRYPVILRIHGGPHGQQGPGFDHKSQVYAGSGYAVVMVNYRGSSGYGQEFTDGTVGDQNGNEFKDVMAGLDAILEKRAYLDPERMGVEGGSYGGQLTNWAITQTDRFKAAIPSASISNLISLAYTIWAQDYIQVEFGGYPWQKDIARFMWERSPLAHLSKVQTPTMFIHGEEDQDVSVVEAEQMYMALKQVGVEAVFLRYPREGHGLREPAHVVDALERSLAWYGRYLNGAAASPSP